MEQFLRMEKDEDSQWLKSFGSFFKETNLKVNVSAVKRRKVSCVWLLNRLQKFSEYLNKGTPNLFSHHLNYFMMANI